MYTPGLITDDEEVRVESTGDFLCNVMAEFHSFIGHLLTVLPREGSPFVEKMLEVWTRDSLTC